MRDDPEEWFRSLRDDDDRWTDAAQQQPHLARSPRPWAGLASVAAAAALIAAAVLIAPALRHSVTTATDDPTGVSAVPVQPLTATVLDVPAKDSTRFDAKKAYGAASTRLSSQGARPSAVWASDHRSIVVTIVNPCPGSELHFSAELDGPSDIDLGYADGQRPCIMPLWLTHISIAVPTSLPRDGAVVHYDALALPVIELDELPSPCTTGELSAVAGSGVGSEAAYTTTDFVVSGSASGDCSITGPVTVSALSDDHQPIGLTAVSDSSVDHALVSSSATSAVRAKALHVPVALYEANATGGIRAAPSAQALTDGTVAGGNAAGGTAAVGDAATGTAASPPCTSRRVSYLRIAFNDGQYVDTAIPPTLLCVDASRSSLVVRAVTSGGLPVTPTGATSLTLTAPGVSAGVQHAVETDTPRDLLRYLGDPTTVLVAGSAPAVSLSAEKASHAIDVLSRAGTWDWSVEAEDTDRWSAHGYQDYVSGAHVITGISSTGAVFSAVFDGALITRVLIATDRSALDKG